MLNRNVVCYNVLIIIVEGYKGNSSPQFWMTVNSVATFKTNVYQLKREMWADVQEDWPFYSEQDRALLKRFVFFLTDFVILLQ